MSSVKDLRSKALSDMNADELNSYIKTAEKSGYSISESKDLGKAVDLLKVLNPSKYGSKTVESAKNKLLNNTTPETQSKLGIGATSTGLNSSASGFSGFGSGGESSVNLQKIYEEAVNTPEVQGLQTELENKKSALTTALNNINDNPFYSEATRTGRIAKLNEQAGREISDLEEALASRKADAQVKVNIATQQYNIDDNNYKNNLSKLNLLISSGALLNASGSDVAQIATATGMSTDMVKGIQAQMQKSLVQPQVITSTDNNGNVTVAVVDGATGNIISQNSLGAVGQSKTSAGDKPDSVDSLKPQMTAILQANTGKATGVNEDLYVSPSTWANNLKGWVAERGGSRSAQEEFIGLFNNFVNPSHSEDYFGYDDYFGQ